MMTFPADCEFIALNSTAIFVSSENRGKPKGYLISSIIHSRGGSVQIHATTTHSHKMDPLGEDNENNVNL